MSESTPSVAFVTAMSPPSKSGVGDYTAFSASALAQLGCPVTILTGETEPSHDIPGVRVVRFYDKGQPTQIQNLPAAVAEAKADWIFLQYDPFGFGTRYGWNPYLRRALVATRRVCPKVKIGVTVHEGLLPGGRLKATALSLAHRYQLWRLVRSADAAVVKAGAWVPWLRKWCPRVPVTHLSVGTNLHATGLQPEKARAELGIAPGQIVLGLFGRLQRTRSLDAVRAAVTACQEAGHNPILLYVGLEASVASTLFAGLPHLARGPVEADEAAHLLSVVDIYLVPIDEGVSTRRTSLMAGLALGLPTVATTGDVTESVFKQADGTGLVLASATNPTEFGRAVAELAANRERREALATGGRQLYATEFDWPVIARGYLAAIRGCADARGGLQ